MICSHCDNKKKLNGQVLKAYKLDDPGLSRFTIENVKQYSCDNCGETYFKIPMMEAFFTAAALILTCCEDLTGPELRYLRKYLGFSRDTMGELAGYTYATLNRYETGSKHAPKVYIELLKSMVKANKLDHDYLKIDKALKQKPHYSLVFKKFWSLA